MSLSLASNFSKNHPTGKGQGLSDFCAKHSTHQCIPCGRSTFGVWHSSHRPNMLTGMSSKQDLGRGLVGISHFLIKV